MIISAARARAPMGVLARGGGKAARTRARLRQGCLLLTGRLTFARVADL